MAANSTGAVGKMLRYPQHNRVQKYHFVWYYFALATISTIFSYPKRSKKSLKSAFVAEPRIPLTLPFSIPPQHLWRLTSQHLQCLNMLPWYSTKSRHLWLSWVLLLKNFKALNGLLCADVPLRNYTLTLQTIHSSVFFFLVFQFLLLSKFSFLGLFSFTLLSQMNGFFINCHICAHYL